MNVGWRALGEHMAQPSPLQDLQDSVSAFSLSLRWLVRALDDHLGEWSVGDRMAATGPLQRVLESDALFALLLERARKAQLSAREARSDSIRGSVGGAPAEAALAAAQQQRSSSRDAIRTSLVGAAPAAPVGGAGSPARRESSGYGGFAAGSGSDDDSAARPESPAVPPRRPSMVSASARRYSSASNRRFSIAGGRKSSRAAVDALAKDAMRAEFPDLVALAPVWTASFAANRAVRGHFALKQRLFVLAQGVKLLRVAKLGRAAAASKSQGAPLIIKILPQISSGPMTEVGYVTAVGGLVALSATTVVKMLRDNTITPLECVEEFAAQHALTEPDVRAVPITCLERARAAAVAAAATNAARRAAAAAAPPGYLWGLPIVVKDLTPVAGVRFTEGSPIHADRVAAASGPLVELLEARGAVVVGKSNTPEFGAGAQTFNAVFGTTRNPWDARLTAGGSSGGAAAALACGSAWLATGSDLGGSLRIPAS